jgi:hypothetical protein
MVDGGAFAPSPLQGEGWGGVKIYASSPPARFQLVSNQQADTRWYLLRFANFCELFVSLFS